MCVNLLRMFDSKLQTNVSQGHRHERLINNNNNVIKKACSVGVSAIAYRYIRLTFIYAFVIACWFFYTPYISDGPHYPELIKSSRYSETLFKGNNVPQSSNGGCSKLWWTNLLYINNVYPRDGALGCFGWGWYLANDFQFFIVGVVILILYVAKPLLSYIALGLIFLGCWISSITIVLQNDFETSVLDQVSRSTFKNQFLFYYVRPWVRAPPFFIGLIGALLYVRRMDLLKIAFKFSVGNNEPPVNKLFGITKDLAVKLLFAFLGAATVYITYFANNRAYPKWTVLEDVLYLVFSRYVLKLIYTYIDVL